MITAEARPAWGAFVRHYDTVEQVPTMGIAFGLAKTTLSLLFDRMSVALQDSDTCKLAGSAAMAGSFDIALPDEFSLRGFLLTTKGKVVKTADTSAVLTIAVGQSARAFEWPTTPKTVSLDTGASTGSIQLEEIDLFAECFSRDDHSAIGIPPRFPPLAPLTISIAIQARRRSTEGIIAVTLDSADISMMNVI